MSRVQAGVTPGAKVVQVKLGPVQRVIMNAQERYVDIEGALRSAKTWTCLLKIRRAMEQFPGIRVAICRWTDGDLAQKLMPDYRLVCALMGLPFGEWDAREGCYSLANGSQCYCVHLKTAQTDSRYKAVRGLTVAIIYIDQLEEVPEDVYDEAALRISQPGFPQRVLVSPNPVPESHWIAKKFPVDNKKPLHRYIRLAIYDNRHNLDAGTISAVETLYPLGHPQRPVKVEGRRGLDVHGKPVYAGAFDRRRHEADLPLDPSLPLLECYDYGFHHPACLWMQWAPWGHLRVLGGVMGSNLHLDAFLPVVEKYRALWFPDRTGVLAVCDPAGANENSQGLRGTPVDILRSWFRTSGTLDEAGQLVSPSFQADANHPDRRRAAIDTAATYMRRRVLGVEAFQCDGARWILAELADERFDTWFLNGLEAGYVLEDKPRHSSTLGSYWLPKKDGEFEHFQNCFEYGIQQFVRDLPLAGADAEAAVVKFAGKAARDEARALRHQQQDHDEADPPQTRRWQRPVLRKQGAFMRRGGY